MDFYGPRTNLEHPADFLVGKTLHHLNQNFPLAPGQLLNLGFCRSREALLLGLAMRGETASGGLVEMSRIGVVINISLMVLNLLPIPPLDGGRIAVSLLPHSLAIPFARLEPFGFFILLALLFTHVLERLMRPFVAIVAMFIESITGVGLPRF